MTVFKSCDIRGLYGPELDEALAFRLGRAIATRLPGSRAVVGQDLRESSPALTDALVNGLVASAARVTRVGTVPTPTLYFAKRRLDCPIGIMVTASHNPAQYNGFKLMMGNPPIQPTDIQGLRAEMARGAFWDESTGQVETVDILPDYLEALKTSFCTLTPRRIVVDCGSGSMSEVAPALLADLGLDVVPLYCQPDGRFLERDPNPAVPEHLTDLCQQVVASEAELGIAFDGDGDRVIFCDGRGRVQPADRTLVLLIRHLLPMQPMGAGVVYDQKASLVVAEETDALGGRPLREKSGHAFIKRRLIEERALLGGEISGHYFFASIGGDDALYASLALLSALDALGTDFQQAIDTVSEYPISPDIRLAASPEQARAALSEIEDALALHPIDHLDGVRVTFGDGWALARLSVTEPLITLRFEARTPRRLRQIMTLVRNASPTLQELWAR